MEVSGTGASISANNLTLGNASGDNGTFNVTNGAHVALKRTFIGSAAGSIGNLTVTGANSTLTNQIFIFRVGESGNGTMTVSDGGTVSLTAFDVGYNSSGTGNVTVTGAGSSLSTSLGNMTIGDNGTGTMTISDGGSVSAGINLRIGAGFSGQPPGTGSVTVTGAGSTLIGNATGGTQSDIGDVGTGTLIVSAGGLVAIKSVSSIGSFAGGTGTVTVTGTGSTFNSTRNLIVGDSGTGTLTVDSGGLVTAPTVIVANSGAGQGTLNLKSGGALSTLYVIEGSGTGGGTINFAGGTLQATADSTDFISGFETGDVTLGTGGAIIDSNTHAITITNTFSGTGGLTKTGTGTLTMTGANGNAGALTVKQGTVEVTGAGASIGGATVGNVSGDNGIFILSNGAQDTGGATIGNDAGSVGTVTVTGVNANGTASKLSSGGSGTIAVGYKGTATLNIENGGIVSDVNGVIGTVDGSGTVTVTGVGSTWSNQKLQVGYFGSGTLTVSNGGTVTSEAVSAGIGINANSISSATVTGTGSTLTIARGLSVGSEGQGTLTVADGGTVTTANVGLANLAAGKGTVNLNSGGILATGNITEGQGTGAINFGGGTLQATADSTDFISQFETGDVTLGSGGGTIDSNTHAITVNTVLGGSGGLTKTGDGTLTFSGTDANTYAGTTTVSAGELDLNKTAGVDAVAGNVTVNGGTLKWLADNQVANTSAISMSSGTLDLNGKSETITSFTNSGGTFSTGAGHLTGTGATITWSGGTNTVNTGGTVEDAHIVINDGTNTVEAGGTLKVISGGVGFETTGGTLTINSDATTPGKLVLNNGLTSHASATTSVLASGGTAASPGQIDFGGTYRYFTVEDGAAATDLAISANITNGSLYKRGAGTMTLTGNSQGLDNLAGSDGTLEIIGATTTLQANFLSVGGLNVTADLILSDGAIANVGTFGVGYIPQAKDATATVTGSGTQVNATNVRVGQYGTSHLTISNGAVITNTTGTIGVRGQGGAPLSSVLLTGATSSWVNSGSLVVGASELGILTVEDGGTASASTVYLGYSRYGQGVVNLNSGGTLATEQVIVGTNDNTGKLNFDGGILKATADSADFLKGFGAGDIKLGTNGGTIHSNGHIVTVASILSDVGGLTKTGAGTVKLAAANTYTGATTIAQGTLQLGVANAIASTSAVHLSGGTFDIAGLSPVAFTAPLTVDGAGSTLDFGLAHLGGVTLQFGDSSGVTWTSNLTLIDFTVGLDALGFGSDVNGLTAAQLAYIDLSGYTAIGLDSNGFVQFEAAPVPEPTLALVMPFGIALLVYGVWRRRSASGGV